MCRSEVKLRARRRDSKRAERSYAIPRRGFRGGRGEERTLARERVVNLSRRSMHLPCISVRPSVIKLRADFHSDIRDDDERARRLANPWRSWTSEPVKMRRRARVLGLLSLLYSCRSTKVSTLQWAACEDPPSRFSRQEYESITNESNRELFFYAARAFPPPPPPPPFDRSWIFRRARRREILE